MDQQNLLGVRDTVRIRTGLTEKGESGDTRLNSLINLGVRQLWNDQPHVFQKQEIRILLQESISDGTLDVNPLDQRCFRSSSPSAPWSDVDHGLLRGRWIDITDTDGNIHTRRILSVSDNQTVVGGDWADASPAVFDLVYVDRPWINSTDTGLAYRIYTLDYPLPADVVDVSAVFRNPETDGFEELIAAYPAELDTYRVGAWNESGLPESYSDGDFTQLRAPHDTPNVIVPNGIPADLSNAWGYDDNGDENVGFGSAGTFSYCYCLVRGRLNSPTRTLAVGDGENGRELPPFYISAPSTPSEQVETVWGGYGIAIGSINQDWHDMRKQSMGGNNAIALAPDSGLEKWWFRACHESASDGNVGVGHLTTEADGVYRLWRITTADEVAIVDKGQFDPPDYSYPLKEFTGHKSIRFDRTPGNDSTAVLVRATVRPDLLRSDQDVLPIPPPAVEAVVNKVCQYIAERDGDLNKSGYYRGLYEDAVNRLRERDGWTSTKKSGFGDGVTANRTRSWKMAPRIYSSE